MWQLRGLRLSATASKSTWTSVDPDLSIAVPAERLWSGDSASTRTMVKSVLPGVANPEEAMLLPRFGSSSCVASYIRSSVPAVPLAISSVLNCTPPLTKQRALIVYGPAVARVVALEEGDAL